MNKTENFESSLDIHWPKSQVGNEMSRQLEITNLQSRKWDGQYKKHCKDDFDTSKTWKSSTYFDKKKIS